MYSLMRYFFRLERIAHDKTKTQSTVKTNFCVLCFLCHSHLAQCWFLLLHVSSFVLVGLSFLTHSFVLDTCLMVLLPALSVILACVLMYSVSQQWLKVPQCHDPRGASSSWSWNGGCWTSDRQFSWSDWLTEWLIDSVTNWLTEHFVSALVYYWFTHSFFPLFITFFFFLYLSVSFCWHWVVHTHFPVSWLHIKIVPVSF